MIYIDSLVVRLTKFCDFKKGFSKYKRQIKTSWWSGDCICVCHTNNIKKNTQNNVRMLCV